MTKLRRALVSRALASMCLGGCLAAVCTTSACDQKPAPGAEVSHALPPLDPAALTSPTAMPHAEHAPPDPTIASPHGAMPPGHPPVGGATGADPHGGMEALAPGDIPFDKNTVLSGKLVLAAKLKGKVAPHDVIFFMVRGVGDGTTPGPVLAVQRVEADAFPLAFQLDGRNAMVVGTQLKGPVVLSARVDKDGDAMTKNPGDVVGSLDVKSLPAEKLSLTLDKVL